MHTHKKKKKKIIAANVTSGYKMCDVNTEDTNRYNIALMTSTTMFYIPYPLGTIIK